MDDGDKGILREFYNDYKATIGGRIGAFPFNSLDDFLCNLDGGKNAQGNHIGSVDWRYFLIEEIRSKEMPTVSVDYLHEIVHGCIVLLKYADANRHTYSWRLRRERERIQGIWLRNRMNSADWEEYGDRLEILWGPDYRERYDLYLFEGKSKRSCFSKIPDDLDLQTVDKRKEVEAFCVEQPIRAFESE